MKTMKGSTLFLGAVLAFLLCGCANERSSARCASVKKVDDKKLSLIVLSKSEYDRKENIIHKRTGSYKDTADDSFSQKLKGKRFDYDLGR